MKQDTVKVYIELEGSKLIISKRNNNQIVVKF